MTSKTSLSPKSAPLRFPLAGRNEPGAHGASSRNGVVRRVQPAPRPSRTSSSDFRQSSPLHVEDRKARDEGDADNQRAPVRNQTARELYKLMPEQATEARRQGAIRYVSADQRERVAKQRSPARSRGHRRDQELRASGETVPSNSPISVATDDSIRHSGPERRYGHKRRKLAGAFIPGRRVVNCVITYARRLKDPQYELLRGSPAAFGISA